MPGSVGKRGERHRKVPYHFLLRYRASWIPVNADKTGDLPRPALLTLAVSTMVIAVAVVGIYRNLTLSVGSYVLVAAGLGLLVTQVRSTFFRSYRAAQICTVLLVLFALLCGYRWYVMSTDKWWRGWNLLCDFEQWRTGVVTLFFVAAAAVSILWCWGLSGFKTPARLIRRYWLDELGVMLASLCLVAAAFAGMFRRPPNYEEMSEVRFSTDWAVAAEQRRETAALAEMLRPKLPAGWTLVVRGREVVIERNVPIETFWWMSFPDGVNDLAQARAYVRSKLLGGRRIPQKFAVVLWLDTKLTESDHGAIFAKNRTADGGARGDHPNEKFIPTRQFWMRNPDYGYRRLPSFATESHSVYMKVNPSDMSIWDYLNAAEEQDCEALLAIVREQFTTDYHCEACAD